eukprot:NODE_22463_length_707_cov_1.948276.p5 GENE.NODE_22463_length_707_cov_1.948276~~NODE_22463_length_707_cov_1.948276.p5  ORF type:complete len:61 (-),score=14.47 NODE_22463_length_707_cov_1.948276:408-590(-)
MTMLTMMTTAALALFVPPRQRRPARAPSRRGRNAALCQRGVRVMRARVFAATRELKGALQ